MASATRPVTILTWNVHGLGEKCKCDNIWLMLPSYLPAITCFQETLPQHIDTFKAATFLPHLLASSFAFSPSSDASRGILTAWNPNFLTLTASSSQHFSLTTTFTATATNLSFTVTNCYGPCDHADKLEFLEDLALVHSSVAGAWLLLGNFNIIRLPEERSNGNFDTSEAATFNSAIDAMALQVILLLDWRFTWSNH